MLLMAMGAMYPWKAADPYGYSWTTPGIIMQKLVQQYGWPVRNAGSGCTSSRSPAHIWTRSERL